MLIIPINLGNKVPLYEQIYEYIKREIKTGKLPVATKLPSSRNLAQSLQISRSTVELAYQQLISEGYIESIPKSGYYVQGIMDLIQITERKKALGKEKVEKVERLKYDFSPFAVDLSEFPFPTWRKLSNQCMNDMNQSLFLLGENQGDLSLREAIVAYLHSSRGVKVEASQVIVGAGADYLLVLLSQILGNDQIIAMENPVYKRAYRIFQGVPYPVRPITVNTDGISIEELTRTDASIVYVTPSHQYPLGTVMPIKRRLELLQWAAKGENRYIIEDDHDSEFRYKGKPIPSLQGIDENDRVIYLGTFSRAIAPAIRMGFMVLPQRLYQVYREKYSFYASTVSRIDQAIVCEFLNGGYFERHVNKMRKRYKMKHDLLLHELKPYEDRITITGENAGLHIVVSFHTSLTEEEILKKVHKKEIELYPLSKHYITDYKPTYPTFLMGFANLSEELIIAGVNLLIKELFLEPNQ
ncbi:PLP-dependent aminotransferase family protein [Lachnoclostridium sp.]|nr:PLP-dependent aminotransferase family protein [Lachnoclostridium sp.]